MNSPLSQFDIICVIPLVLFGYDISVTNLTISTILALSIGGFILLFLFNNNLIPNIWQVFLESVFIFIFRLVYSQTGKLGLVYFPFIFALFFFILLLNLISLTPFGFAVTSHLIWTIYFSCSICLGIFFIGIIRHKIKFFKIFVPEVPLLLYPLMIFIEIFSYIIRSFSLAIRLTANIVAGHTLVHIIVNAIFFLCSLKKIIVILPYILLLFICVLELGIACLQAYIFVTLTCMYLNDSLNLNSH